MDILFCFYREFQVWLTVSVSMSACYRFPESLGKGLPEWTKKESGIKGWELGPWVLLLAVGSGEISGQLIWYLDTLCFMSLICLVPFLYYGSQM